MAKIVIALGGNALGNSPDEQRELVKIPAAKIANLTKLGHDVIVGHGNGPQVGMIYNTFANANTLNPKSPKVEFPESGAMSQGYIGLHLVTAVSNELKKLNIDKDVVYFLTQTIVDEHCSSFDNPSKPVGPFYNNQKDCEESNPNSRVIDDAGRGWRKVVASPIPHDFVGIRTIKKNVDNKALVIVGGGGGVPTIIKNNQYVPVDGVVDKDFALAKIAEKVDADVLVVLTGVDYVYVNYNKPDQKKLEKATVKELEQYIKENQFAPGSMLPKVQAAIQFVKSKPGREAIIADLLKVEDALNGKSGTKVVLE